jgi:hypothetical protein
MSIEIGTMILVDTAALIRDFGLHYNPETDRSEGQVPVIDLADHYSGKNYVVMVAPNEYSKSGMGTKDLILKVGPGDEIKWWGEPIYSNTSADFFIRQIKPVNANAVRWGAWSDDFRGSLASVTYGKGERHSGVGGNNGRWEYLDSDPEYRLRIKNQSVSESQPVALRYQIAIEIVNKPGKTGRSMPLGIFYWETAVMVYENSGDGSNDVKSIENQVAAGFVDRDSFFTN